MRVVLTGSSGRVGRAIHRALAGRHEVIGIDRAPFATTQVVGDFTDRPLLEPLLDGADAVIHTAALHAPQVGIVSDGEFTRINVDGTQRLLDAAIAAGVRRFVMTSTTALYGHAVREGRCTWIDETTVPEPKTIYHRTKLAAEALVAQAARDHASLVTRVIRMSRCFPEPAPTMAVYRLCRGIDLRDVGEAHVRALDDRGSSHAIYIASGATPFLREDCAALAESPATVLAARAPALVEAFARRGWPLPSSIDRIYSARAIEDATGWRTRYGFAEVLDELDRRSIEVLAPT